MITENLEALCDRKIRYLRQEMCRIGMRSVMPGGSDDVNAPSSAAFESRRYYSALIVILSGGFGGALARATGFSQALGVDWNFAASVLLNGALGSLAASVFVFIVANTDRTDFARLLALAALAGFFWSPVLQNGRDMFSKKALIEKADAVTAAGDNIKEEVANLQKQAGLSSPSPQLTSDFNVYLKNWADAAKDELPSDLKVQLDSNLSDILSTPGLIEQDWAKAALASRLSEKQIEQLGVQNWENIK